jgi:hypothetical protein
MSKYSSFKSHQLITENWRKYLKEDEDFLDVGIGEPDPPPQLSPAELGARIINDQIVDKVGLWLINRLNQSGIYDLDPRNYAGKIKKYLKNTISKTPGDNVDRNNVSAVLDDIAKEVFHL